MADQLRFDGRVVIITGAGNGLGRSHALMFGARGAKVVVNDLGGGAHGEGNSAGPADAVVAEIRAAGGEAVANHDSVENGERIVQTALDTFGTVDIVVNNAGILRDSSFHKMTAEDWDLIYRVHLKGAFRVTHAAWPIMREKQYGRVIMTGSAAGIYGNFGQANYSAMKLGLLGLANTLAVEGRSKNILVNTIAPVAASRLTESVLPKELFDSLKPELISPLVLWLCHESSTESGGLFELGAGHITKLRWERTQGHAFRHNAELRPEQIASSWPKICNFEDATHPNEVTASMAELLEHMSRPGRGGNEFIDLDAAASQPPVEYEAAYNERDLALYALGVGAGADPLDPTELAFLNEGSGDFQALPTYAAIPAANAMLQMAKEGASLPGLNVGFDRILHGEQYVELRRPLPTSARLKHKIKLRDAYDKGEHAIAVVEVRSFDESGQQIAYNEMTSFLRGCGGWGGERGPSGEVNVPPTREPDAVVEEKTAASQALLYRLSGDWNPLHVDPAFAKAFGFDRPILHGLCTFGYAGRHVLKAFAGGDPRRFRSIKVRFTGMVFPGETLVTRMWKESDKRIVFETSVKERDKVVIKNAAVELGEPLVASASAAATDAKPKAEPDAGPATITSADVFNAIGTYVAQTPDVVSRANVVLEFRLSKPDSVWALDLKNAPGSVTSAPATQPDATLACADEDFVNMCLGTTDAMKLFMSGKLKITGNMGAAQKLEFFKKLNRSLVEDAMHTRLGLKKGESPKATSPGKRSGATEIFRGVAARFESDRQAPAVTAGQVVVFKVQEPDATWQVDFRGASPAIVECDHAEPSVVIHIADEDLVALAAGAATAQDLFQRGRLRVDGNVRLARELDFLVGSITA
jgi:3-hydroxyacyl-CoA dehydrogenase/3a,7a,12a-trihydroxy-5b-cholest-24-enoyl-CoA hydratase